MKAVVFRLIIAMVLAWALALPVAAQQVGEASRVLNWAYRTPSDAERVDLFLNDGVEANDLLATVPEGQLEVTFEDGSVLRVDKGSSVVVDQFVYSGSNGDALHIKLGEGAMRFITGQIHPGAVQIETPLGYLGIRGTDTVIEIVDPRTVIAFVLIGKIIASANPIIGLLYPDFVPPTGLQPDGSVVAGAGYKIVIRRNDRGGVDISYERMSPPEFRFVYNRLLFIALAMGGQHLGFPAGPDGPNQDLSRGGRIDSP